MDSEQELRAQLAKLKLQAAAVEAKLKSAAAAPSSAKEGAGAAAAAAIDAAATAAADCEAGAENGQQSQKKKKKKKKKKRKGNVPDHVEPGATPDGGGEWAKSDLSPSERYTLARSVGAECTKEEELKMLFEKKDHPVCYDGFEPSGRVHIAQGLLKAMNVNKLTRCGCVFKFWVADWFVMLNHKMGGDLAKIRTTGEYMVEVWKACGMDMRNVKFLWASDEINAQPGAYWARVMDIATRNRLPRILRCCTIMGRKDSDEMSASQIFYPCMQAADVFFLKADICQLGMDQRKVNMLAREYCDQMEPKARFKPVILSHGMLSGLKQGQEKMSKSDPMSAIFMEDTAKDVRKKIKGAYCPPQQVEKNPCLEYVRVLCFGMNDQFELKRKDENGGDKVYETYEDLEKDFVSGALHPGDLKVRFFCPY